MCMQNCPFWTLYALHSVHFYLQSATKLVETVANRAHCQRHIHCLQRKLVQKVCFRDTPPSPTLINVVPLSTRLVENRKKHNIVLGVRAIFTPSLKLTLKDKSVSTILTPIVGKHTIKYTALLLRLHVH